MGITNNTPGLDKTIENMRKHHKNISETEYVLCNDCKTYHAKETMHNPAWREGHNLVCDKCFTRISAKRKSRGM